MKRSSANAKAATGSVYCLMCTHTVEADVVRTGRRMAARSGQKCPRCSSSLDTAYVVMERHAA